MDVRTDSDQTTNRDQWWNLKTNVSFTSVNLKLLLKVTAKKIVVTELKQEGMWMLVGSAKETTTDCTHKIVVIHKVRDFLKDFDLRTNILCEILDLLQSWKMLISEENC